MTKISTEQQYKITFELNFWSPVFSDFLCCPRTTSCIPTDAISHPFPFYYLEIFLQWNKSCRAEIWPCTRSNRHDDRCFTETGTKLFSAAFIRQQRPSDLCDRVTGASCLYIYWLAFYCVARWNRCSIFPFFFFFRHSNWTETEDIQIVVGCLFTVN